MNHTSVRTALTATGVGMTLLLAGCGSGGSGSGAGSTLPAADTASSPAQTGSASSSASGAASTTSSAPSSAAVSTSEASTGKPSAKPSTKPSIHPSAGDKPVALCTVGQLRITVGSGNSDMQGSHRPLRFTNTSNQVCKLTGAPGVSYRSASSGGHQIGPPAKRIVGHQPIVLIPNATGSAGLFISSAPRKSDCAKVTAPGILVYPPDSYDATFVSLPEVTCASATSGPYLTVGPILPGPNNTGD